ncbi:MAG: endolytic transglycosylase MltG [Candidatus Planktophila sp.]
MKIDRDNLRGVAGVLAALLIIAVIHFLKPGISTAEDFACNSKSGAQEVIDIHSGEMGSQIAQELFEKKVIASYESFFRVAVDDERSGRIAPGLHSIDTHLCAKTALEQLLDSSRIGNLLAINEGAWNSEIKSALAKIGYSQSQIAHGFSQVTVPTPFSVLEGLLFPAQYSFDSETSVSEILESMIIRGQSELKKSGILNGQGKYTPAQLLTIASLVQAEGDRKDFAKISQVVRNRLTIGMPLQFDSTVHYIKGSRGKVFLSTQSTLISSAYNTYRRYGLPPGPINNPGFEAMYAATHPEQGAWLYFITVAPGDTRFTDSLAEFNNWKVIYKKNLSAGKFG